MALDPETLREIAELTEVVRAPKQALATFGMTSITYFMVTEPAYGGLALGLEESAQQQNETVVRRGLVVAERPQIVTPYYLLSLFRGFEHGQEFAQVLLEKYGANNPGLMYSYRNELQETSIVSDAVPRVARRLAAELDDKGETLAAVVQGVDFMWDVSLMKFIFELTVKSLGQNVADLGQRGLLGHERGLPRAARVRLDEMFAAVARGELAAAELKAELDRWGAFEEYEDRFLNLFRR